MEKGMIEELQEEIQRLRQENEELKETQGNLCALRDSLSQAIAEMHANRIIQEAGKDPRTLDTSYAEAEEWLLDFYFSDQDQQSIEAFKRIFERVTLGITGHIKELRRWRPKPLDGTAPEDSVQLRLRTALLDVLSQRFDEGELETLCFNTGVEYEDLPAQGRKNKARELVRHFDNRNRLPDLVQAIESQRPDAWPPPANKR